MTISHGSFTIQIPNAATSSATFSLPPTTDYITLFNQQTTTGTVTLRVSYDGGTTFQIISGTIPNSSFINVSSGNAAFRQGAIYRLTSSAAEAAARDFRITYKTRDVVELA